MSRGRIRSLAVSLTTTGLDLGKFTLCTLVLVGGTTLAAARWICGAIGALCNFVLNRSFAFGARRGRAWHQGARYTAVAASAVSLATALWWALFVLTGWDPRLLHVLSLALVWLGFTFPLLRDWVFRPRPAGLA
jgi:putative flippase GtrA